jgi:leucyl-tRNA synthetase
MFPYPSGALHLGHVRVYTLSDVISRVQRMRGYDVLHPMGWDSFGLPAENAAIERGVSPATWTDRNIDQMRAQLDALGFRFDWHRGVKTSGPEYYRWTQWLFLQLHRAGLAYRKEAVVNWDPVDCTVLANEQVAADGTSWRSGAVVEQRLLPQWFVRITAMAEALNGGLKTALAGAWPDQVLTLQENWIGQSTGVRVVFPVELEEGAADGRSRGRASAASSGSSGSTGGSGGSGGSGVTVFTTRADTIMGVTFLAVAPTHSLAKGVSRKEGEAARVPGLWWPAAVDSTWRSGVPS